MAHGITRRGAVARGFSPRLRAGPLFCYLGMRYMGLHPVRGAQPSRMFFIYRGEEMRTKHIALVALILAVFALGTAQAQTVVIPDKATPAEEVELRKFAMRALNSNLRDIRLKLKRGDSDGMLTPALNIASIIQLLPYVYQKTHESAYPVPGSNKYFKGADPAAFQANAEYLNAQALKLLRLASGKDLKAIGQQDERIKRACISCHKEMRGEK